MKNLISSALFILGIIPAAYCIQKDTSDFVIVDFTFKSGFYFPNSIKLQNMYDSKSVFNWGFEMNFGTSRSKLIPWIGYSRSKLSIDTFYYQNYERIKRDSLLIDKQQILLGLNTPVKLSSGDILIFNGDCRTISLMKLPAGCIQNLMDL